MIARLERGHSRPHFRHDSGSFVAEDHGKRSLQVASHYMQIAMANASSGHLDQHFTRFRGLYLNLSEV
jgi:hypothetical protein